MFGWEEHWARLRASAEALHLELPLSAELALREIRRTAEAHRAATKFSGEYYIRLQITRGAGTIGLDVALADRPDYVFLAQPCPELPPAKSESGLRLSVASHLRRNPAQALNPAWKTGNYLNNLLCLREAKASGADDVVILNLAGEVTEASVSNIAFVSEGCIVTPPLSAGILGGITRGLILREVASRAGLAAREEALRPGDFQSMDECLLLSTTRDIVPVASIDKARFPVGPETVTTLLKRAFAEYARDYAAAHPGLRIAG